MAVIVADDFLDHSDQSHQRSLQREKGRFGGFIGG